MDVPPQVGLGDVLGHQGQANRLAHRPGSQVPLGGKDVRVLVGIFVDDAWVLVDQLSQALLGVSFCPPVSFIFLPLGFVFLGFIQIAQFVQAGFKSIVDLNGVNRVGGQLGVNLAQNGSLDFAVFQAKFIQNHFQLELFKFKWGAIALDELLWRVGKIQAHSFCCWL